MIEFFFDLSSPWTYLAFRNIEPLARGGFGSPTLFVNGADMYFGNDRLPLVRAVLQNAKTRP